MLRMVIFNSLWIQISWSSAEDIATILHKQMSSTFEGNGKTFIQTLESHQSLNERWSEIEKAFRESYPGMCGGDLQAAIASQLTTEDATNLHELLRQQKMHLPKDAIRDAYNNCTQQPNEEALEMQQRALVSQRNVHYQAEPDVADPIRDYKGKKDLHSSPKEIAQLFYQRMLDISEWQAQLAEMGAFTNETFQEVEKEFRSEYPDMCNGDLQKAIATKLTGEAGYSIQQQLE